MRTERRHAASFGPVREQKKCTCRTGSFHKLIRLTSPGWSIAGRHWSNFCRLKSFSLPAFYLFCLYSCLPYFFILKLYSQRITALQHFNNFVLICGLKSCNCSDKMCHQFSFISQLCSPVIFNYYFQDSGGDVIPPWFPQSSQCSFHMINEGMKTMSVSKSNMCIEVSSAQEKIIKIKNCVFPWNSPVHWYCSSSDLSGTFVRPTEYFFYGRKISRETVGTIWIHFMAVVSHTCDIKRT